VTFGTGLSYFACAPGCGSLWAGVPSELTDKVQKAFDTPSCVSLGMEQAWYVLWEDGNSAWNFYGNYGELDKTLRQAPPGSVSVSIPLMRQNWIGASVDVNRSTSQYRHTTDSTTLSLLRIDQSGTTSMVCRNGCRRCRTSSVNGRLRSCNNKLSNPTHLSRSSAHICLLDNQHMSLPTMPVRRCQLSNCIALRYSNRQYSNHLCSSQQSFQQKYLQTCCHLHLHLHLHLYLYLYLYLHLHHRLQNSRTWSQKSRTSSRDWQCQRYVVSRFLEDCG
jgi:hypothetical protein